MKKVRCGVIGTGGMGKGHCAYLQKLPEVELTAVCDVKPHVCEEVARQYHAQGFPDAVSLLDSGLVDLVIIATPHYAHPPIAIEAFLRGIHVISEKPIAVSVSAADAMIAAARQSGKVFSVMFQTRTEPTYRAARRLVEEGAVGEIYRTMLITSWYRSQAYYDSGDWRATWAEEGGGVLINQAPHFLDILTWLGGLPTKITAQTRTRQHEIEVEDEAFAFLEYANGAHGYLYASTTEMPSETRIEICGDKGKLVITDGDVKFWQVQGSLSEFTRTATEMWSAPKVEPVAIAVPEVAPNAPKAHSAIIHNTVRAIQAGEPLIAPGEEGLNAVELINAIILSSKRNKPVSVPVPRQEYDDLLEELKATSRPKANVREQRVTDPKFKT